MVAAIFRDRFSAPGSHKISCKIQAKPVGYKSRVSSQKGPTCHAYAWQIGPFWQDTLEVTRGNIRWKVSNLNVLKLLLVECGMLPWWSLEGLLSWYLVMWSSHFLRSGGIVLCMPLANERWRCIVKSSLIGWVHIQNDPWIRHPEINSTGDQSSDEVQRLDMWLIGHQDSSPSNCHQGDMP